MRGVDDRHGCRAGARGHGRRVRRVGVEARCVAGADIGAAVGHGLVLVIGGSRVPRPALGVGIWRGDRRGGAVPRVVVQRLSLSGLLTVLELGVGATLLALGAAAHLEEPDQDEEERSDLEGIPDGPSGPRPLAVLLALVFCARRVS